MSQLVLPVLCCWVNDCQKGNVLKLQWVWRKEFISVEFISLFQRSTFYCNSIGFFLGCLNCNVFSQLQTYPEEVEPCLTKYWRKYITVNPNRTVSLSKFRFFKLLHLLIRSYQVPVLLICPLALSHFLKFKVFSANMPS